jgi:hypothetical protein
MVWRRGGVGSASDDVQCRYEVFMVSEREREREETDLLLYVASVLLGFYLKKKKKIWEERLFVC